MFSIISLFVIIIGFETAVATAAVEPKLVFFYGNNVNANQTYQLTEAVQILQHLKFNRYQNTVLYIHGFVESPLSGTVQSIVNAYIARRTYNILVLDWSALVNGSYVTAVTNSIEVGPTIASILINLFSKGLKPWSLHIVGHSLGGQLAGIIGRSVIQLSANKIKLRRISALDPAFPGFYPPSNITKPIDVNDAYLVDVIHTDAENYGSPVYTGCVDFVVNSGTRFQPGCPVGNFTALSSEDTCSHQRSVAYWAESVANRRRTFLATNSVFPRIKVNMGIDCPTFVLRGTYTVVTNSVSPYSIRP
ncbi:hypothetical protein HA402_007321 [Bradysia odoriphaga]|nr:hypothetical protein HA402_007321 [Bradysia odoriphaga]